MVKDGSEDGQVGTDGPARYSTDPYRGSASRTQASRRITLTSLQIEESFSSVFQNSSQLSLILFVFQTSSQVVSLSPTCTINKCSFSLIRSDHFGLSF